MFKGVDVFRLRSPCETRTASKSILGNPCVLHYLDGNKNHLWGPSLPAGLPAGLGPGGQGLRGLVTAVTEHQHRQQLV